MHHAMHHAMQHAMHHAMQVKQDIDQRIGRDVSARFKHVVPATDEEVQDLADTLCVKMATLPDAASGGRERFDWCRSSSHP